MSTNRYAVKIRRFYNGTEATSVVMAPDTKEVAEAYMIELNAEYQSPGNYYIEKWETKS